MALLGNGAAGFKRIFRWQVRKFVAVSFRPSGIVKAQLHALAAVPVIDLDPACGMERAACMIGQRRCQPVAGRIKANRLDRGGAIRQRQLQMPLADRLGVADAQARQRKARGRGGGPKGASLFQLFDQLDLAGRGHQNPVKAQIGDATRA